MAKRYPHDLALMLQSTIERLHSARLQGCSAAEVDGYVTITRDAVAELVRVLASTDGGRRRVGPSPTRTRESRDLFSGA